MIAKSFVHSNNVLRNKEMIPCILRGLINQRTSRLYMHYIAGSSESKSALKIQEINQRTIDIWRTIVIFPDEYILEEFLFWKKKKKKADTYGFLIAWLIVVCSAWSDYQIWRITIMVSENFANMDKRFDNQNNPSFYWRWSSLLYIRIKTKQIYNWSKKCVSESHVKDTQIIRMVFNISATFLIPSWDKECPEDKSSIDLSL